MSVAVLHAPATPSIERHERIAAQATRCLHLEVDTYPKPGLVSTVDSGAHHDMDAALLHRSAETLRPFFAQLAAAGAAAASMDRLRAIGLAAERAMLAATGGVNTHRGAIFGLGLLTAASGFRQHYAATMSLGTIVANLWGPAILAGPVPLATHGAAVVRRYGVGGARGEASAGFASVYRVALPALQHGMALTGNVEAARVQACFALIEAVDDTNLLHRGGAEGLRFAQARARAFLRDGGVGRQGWRARARDVHTAFTARRLSPGGAADLLAMALFVQGAESAPSRRVAPAC